MILAQRVEAMKAGAPDYLVKPLDKEHATGRQKVLAMRAWLVENLLLKKRGAGSIYPRPGGRFESGLASGVSDGRAGGPFPGHRVTHWGERHGQGAYCPFNPSFGDTAASDCSLFSIRRLCRLHSGGRTFGYAQGAFTGALHRKPGAF